MVHLNTSSHYLDQLDENGHVEEKGEERHGTDVECQVLPGRGGADVDPEGR